MSKTQIQERSLGIAGRATKHANTNTNAKHENTNTNVKHENTNTNTKHKYKYKT